MIRRLILISAATALLAACGASTPERSSSKLSPEEAIAERAKARWEHIIASDFRSAYAYLTPGARVAMPYESYAARMTQAQIRWTGVSVAGVKCEDAEACKAEVLLDITVHVPGAGQLPTQTVQYEDWLESDGQWYYLPQAIQ